MNKLIFSAGIVTLAALISGCWTFCTSEFPEVQLANAANAAGQKTISVTGFESVLTEYEAMHGYQSVYVPGHYGRHHYHPGYYEAVPVTTYVAQRRSSDMFLRRAQDDLEKAGYTLAVANPDILVNVVFEGPIRETGDAVAEFCWQLFTAFMCDYDAVSWTAKLRVRDAKTGKLLFHHDYVQRYETKVFGLIPLFSISACTETNPATMQTWCLAALTDRAIADTAAFLSAK